MRLPRVRVTIGQMMGMVLVVGLASWGVLVVLPSLGEPSLSERLARARYERARLAREVAELSLFEFPSSTVLRNNDIVRGAADLAGADLDRAIDRLDWSSRMHSKGFVSEATMVADRLTLDRAGFDVQEARSRLEVLRNSGRKKPGATALRKIEDARADERAKLDAFGKERAKRRWSGP